MLRFFGMYILCMDKKSFFLIAIHFMYFIFLVLLWHTILVITNILFSILLNFCCHINLNTFLMLICYVRIIWVIWFLVLSAPDIVGKQQKHLNMLLYLILASILSLRSVALQLWFNQIVRKNCRVQGLLLLNEHVQIHFWNQWTGKMSAHAGNTT